MSCRDCFCFFLILECTLHLLRIAYFLGLLSSRETTNFNAFYCDFMWLSTIPSITKWNENDKWFYKTRPANHLNQFGKESLNILLILLCRDSTRSFYCYWRAYVKASWILGRSIVKRTCFNPSHSTKTLAACLGPSSSFLQHNPVSNLSTALSLTFLDCFLDFMMPVRSSSVPKHAVTTLLFSLTFSVSFCFLVYKFYLHAYMCCKNMWLMWAHGI